MNHPPAPAPQSGRSSGTPWLPTPGLALKLSLGYVLFGTVWILVSGWWVHRGPDPFANVHKLEAIKGWVFVLVTAILLGWVLTRYIREIRKSAARLEESEERWQFALEGAGDGVWDWDPQTDKVYFSPTWKAMLGYAEAEVGTSAEEWKQRIHPDDRQPVLAAVQRHLQGETPSYQSEHRLRAKDGSYRWVLDRGKVLRRNAEGHPCRVIGTHADITGRKQTEMFIRRQRDLGLAVASAQRPEQAFELSLDAAIEIAEMDCGGIYLEEAGSGDYRLVVHRGLSTGFHQRIQHWPAASAERRMVAEGKPYFGEYPSPTPSTDPAEGAEGMRTIAVVPLIGVGKVIGCLHLASRHQDQVSAFTRNALQILADQIAVIVCRCRSERALQESEAHFRGLFETLHQGIFYHRADGTLTEVNPAALGITGLARADFLHRTVQDSRWKFVDENGEPLPPENLPSVVALRTGYPVRDAVLAVWNPLTESQVWVEVNATPEFLPGEDHPHQVCVTLHNFTRRRQAEIEARHSASLLRAAMEATMDGLLVVDLAGRIVEFNERFLDLWRMTRELIDAGRQKDLVLPPEEDPALRHFFAQLKDPASFAAKVAELYSQPSATSYDTLEFKDGRVLERYSCPQLLGGEPVGRVWSFRDVTERVRSVQALNESAQRFRLLVEKSSDLVSELDREGRFHYASPNHEAILGHRPDELVGTPALDRVHPDDLPACREQLQLSMGRATLRFRKKDGSYCSIDSRGGHFVSASGSDRVVVVSRDITAALEAEAALRESEARYRTVVNVLAEGIVMQDTSGRFLAANASAERILGLTLAELLARDPIDHRWNTVREDGTPFPGEEYPTMVTLRTGKPCSQIIMGVPKADGSTSWISINTQPLMRAGETVPWGVVASFADITRRKQAEDSLRELSTRLLRLQDEERRRIARELHETTAQGLAALVMNLSLLNSAADFHFDARARPILADGLALATQCATEIRTLAYLLHPPVLDELGLLGAIRDYTDGFARRSGMRVDLELPPARPPLSREAELALFRVLQEALTNAHRHSGATRVSIRLSNEGSVIRLEVRDHGQGLRLPSDKPEGTIDIGRFGVGVAGMEERLRQLGGQLEIKSGSDGVRVTAEVSMSENTTDL